MYIIPILACIFSKVRKTATLVFFILRKYYKKKMVGLFGPRFQFSGTFHSESSKQEPSDKKNMMTWKYSA